MLSWVLSDHFFFFFLGGGVDSTSHDSSNSQVSAGSEPQTLLSTQGHEHNAFANQGRRFETR